MAFFKSKNCHNGPKLQDICPQMKGLLSLSELPDWNPATLLFMQWLLPCWVAFECVSIISLWIIKPSFQHLQKVFWFHPGKHSLKVNLSRPPAVIAVNLFCSMIFFQETAVPNFLRCLCVLTWAFHTTSGDNNNFITLCFDWKVAAAVKSNLFTLFSLLFKGLGLASH